MTADQNTSNTPQSPTESLHLHCGHNAEVLKQYPDCHFDVIVTDPPYGIEFLGKDWDSHTGAIETWQQCFRVLKPGGHLLAFSAARTYHHLATNIESTGFEIRDQLMWIYSSGFPKAQDVGKAIQKRLGVKKTQAYKENIPRVGGTGTTDAYDMCRAETVCTSPEAQQWSGWKTALKPGHEPIVMARRPMKSSTIDCVLTHGVGALNIDATRIPFEDAKDIKSARFGQDKDKTFGYINTELQDTRKRENMIVVEPNPQGRYPSNVMGDIPDYQKYFYCPKVSRKERHVGFDKQYTTGDAMRELGGNWTQMETASGIKSVMTRADGSIMPLNEVQVIVEQKNIGNNHPTVKPVALMRYLIELVTSRNSVVLDPFMGSGSTGMAAVELGHTFVGIDLDPNYVEIARKRITGWVKTKDHTIKTATHSEPTDLWDDLFE